MHYPSSFFDPKHFLAENGAPESIYFLTPNTQYSLLVQIHLKIVQVPVPIPSFHDRWNVAEHNPGHV